MQFHKYYNLITYIKNIELFCRFKYNKIVYEWTKEKLNFEGGI